MMRVLWLPLACLSSCAFFPGRASQGREPGLPVDTAALMKEREARYQETVRRDPGDPVALYNLGVISDRKGRLGTAMDFYRSAIRENPFFTDAFYNLGYDLLVKGNHPEAVDTLRFADFLSPGEKDISHNLEAAFCRAILERIDDGRPAPADSLLKLFSARFPSSRHLKGLKVALGRCFLERGRPEQGLKLLETEAAVDSAAAGDAVSGYWTAEALFLIGTHYAARPGESGNAVEALNRCASLRTARAPAALEALSSLYLDQAESLLAAFSFAKSNEMLFLFRKSCEAGFLSSQIAGRGGYKKNRAAVRGLLKAESFLADTLLHAAVLPSLEKNVVKRRLVRAELIKASCGLVHASDLWWRERKNVPDGARVSAERGRTRLRAAAALIEEERALLDEAFSPSLGEEERLQLIDIHRELCALRIGFVRMERDVTDPLPLLRLEKAYTAAIDFEKREIRRLKDEIDSLSGPSPQ